MAPNKPRGTAGGLDSPKFERRSLVTKITVCLAWLGRPWGSVPAAGVLACLQEPPGGRRGGKHPGNRRQMRQRHGLGLACLFWWSWPGRAAPREASAPMAAWPLFDRRRGHCCPSSMPRQGFRPLVPGAEVREGFVGLWLRVFGAPYGGWPPHFIPPRAR